MIAIELAELDERRLLVSQHCWICGIWVFCEDLAEDLLCICGVGLCLGEEGHGRDDASSVGIFEETRHFIISSLLISFMADDSILPIPNLALPQHLFVLSNPAFSAKHADASLKLLDGIRADRAFPLPLFAH